MLLWTALTPSVSRAMDTALSISYWVVALPVNHSQVVSIALSSVNSSSALTSLLATRRYGSRSRFLTAEKSFPGV